MQLKIDNHSKSTFQTLEAMQKGSTNLVTTLIIQKTRPKTTKPGLIIQVKKKKKEEKTLCPVWLLGKKPQFFF